MKMYVRLISLILAAASAALLVSCGGTPPAGSDEATASGTDTAITEADVTNELTDDLPPLDFEGHEFLVYSRYAPLYFLGPLDVEAENGEVVNDAIFRRNRTVEERLNIVFTELTYTNNDQPRTLLLAADDTYDMMQAKGLNAFNYAAEGLLREWKELDYIDLDKPWWDMSITDALYIKNKLYFAVGAYNLSSYEFTHMLLFNKNLAENLNLGDLYAIVNDGSWTFDKFHSLALQAVADLDGDGRFTDADQYGLVSQPKQVLPCFWIAANVLSIDRDADGTLTFAAKENPKFAEVYQRIFEVTRGDNIFYEMSISLDDVNEISKLFVAGQSLFHDVDCNRVPALRSMDTDFGILPFPKYTEAQDRYYTRIEGCEMPIIPLAVGNLDRTGAILEAMSSTSYTTVVPAYYEVALKGKYTRDETSVEMLNIIFGNRVYDLGDTILTSEMRDGPFREKYAADDRDLASTLATMESAVLAKLKKFSE